MPRTASIDSARSPSSETRKQLRARFHLGSHACYDFLVMPFSILVGRQGARLKIFSPWKPQEWTTCPTTICEDHARPRATSRGQVMAAQGLVYGRRLQHRIICSQPFQRGARLNACCRCGAKTDVQRVNCMKEYEHRKRTHQVGKKNRDISLSPAQVHMQRLRAERGSRMGSMQMAGCMKRVEVIGLGELYKVGQSVQSKHRHQHPQISRTNSPRNQASKRRSRHGLTKGVQFTPSDSSPPFSKHLLAFASAA